ncbi:MAG: hypothetical protein AAF226_16850, partial [Verrucomicrobiota bacterium]
LARALVPEPRLVLLDEPFSNLDPNLRIKLRDEIEQILRRVKASALIVTHDTDDALAIGDRVAVLSGGRVEQIGTPTEIYRSPVNRYVANAFGVANLVREGEKERWLRPSQMKVTMEPVVGGVEVKVVAARDVGKATEVRVDEADGEGWTLFMDQGLEIEIGQRLWVQW